MSPNEIADITSVVRIGMEVVAMGKASGILALDIGRRKDRVSVESVAECCVLYVPVILQHPATLCSVPPPKSLYNNNNNNNNNRWEDTPHRVTVSRRSMIDV